MAMERATQITVNYHVSTTVNTRTLAWHVSPADQDVWDSYKDLQQAPGRLYTSVKKATTNKSLAGRKITVRPGEWVILVNPDLQKNTISLSDILRMPSTQAHFARVLATRRVGKVVSPHNVCVCVVLATRTSRTSLGGLINNMHIPEIADRNLGPDDYVLDCAFRIFPVTWVYTVFDDEDLVDGMYTTANIDGSVPAIKICQDVIFDRTSGGGEFRVGRRSVSYLVSVP